MQDCQVCGRSFDPMGFQVVIPELGRGFDRIECAQTARSLATPGSRLAAAPVAAVVAPIAAAAAAFPAAGMRPFATPAATLGFLAAGTAAAAFLWGRALGTDSAAFPFVSADAPPAVAGATVEANPALGSAGEPKAAVSPRADTPRPVVIGSTGDSGAADAPARAESPSGSREGSRARSGDGKVKDKSNQGHHGKGHTKHGDTGTSHEPGHGQSHGGHGGHGGSGRRSGSAHAGGHGKRH